MAENIKDKETSSQQHDFDNTPTAGFDDTFPGFSERLNRLLDLTDLSIPSMNNGRQTYLSNLLNISKMPPGDWLKKDRPPKTITLRKLIAFFLNHISGDHDPNLVEAWLQYGNSVPNPFQSAEDDNQALTPLATSLIVSVAQEIGTPVSKIDLNPVLSSTIEMLAYFRLAQDSVVDPVYRALIARQIKSHPR